MQREIDDLKRKLRRAQRKRSPSNSDASSNEEDDEGREHPQVRPFLMRRSLTLCEGMRARPARVWEMTL